MSVGMPELNVLPLQQKNKRSCLFSEEWLNSNFLILASFALRWTEGVYLLLLLLLLL